MMSDIIVFDSFPDEWVGFLRDLPLTGVYVY